eukprot:2571314-Rhodomonas_salina.1
MPARTDNALLTAKHTLLPTASAGTRTGRPMSGLLKSGPCWPFCTALGGLGPSRRGPGSEGWRRRLVRR